MANQPKGKWGPALQMHRTGSYSNNLDDEGKDEKKENEGYEMNSMYHGLASPEYTAQEYPVHGKQGEQGYNNAAFINSHDAIARF
jgi:hypothetical protein